MVVLAASITSKRSGKVLVLRQFVDMSRIRIEGLLAAFHMLIDNKKHHTYVETESVRYVYQPIENLYMVLVTNKQSNIVDDLDTLRLLSKVVSKYCTSLNEEDICKNAFELVFAFEEVISLGHKENVTISDVEQYCEMESEEERLHKLEQQRKINEAMELMKSKASEIDKRKEKLVKRGSSSLQSMGSSSVSGSNPSYDIVESSYDIGRGSRFGSSYDIVESSSSNSEGNPNAFVGAPSRGMTLGNSQRANRFVESCIER